MKQADPRCVKEDAFAIVEVAGRCSVALDPSSGLTRWSVGDRDVIGAAPPDRQLGPLTGVHASIWFALQPSRCDPDAGAVWAPPDPRLGYRTGVNEWRVEPWPDSRLILHSRARSAGSHPSELVTYLALPDAEAELWDPAQGWLAVSARTPSWRAWTGRCLLRTAGGVMQIDPISGLVPEILVRRGSFGIVLAMHSRIDSVGVDAVWQLRFTEGAPVDDLQHRRA